MASVVSASLDQREHRRYRIVIVLSPRRFPLVGLAAVFLVFAAPRAPLAWEAARDASGAIEIRDGGKIVAKGTPEDIAASEKSYTGKYLKRVLGRK